MKEYFYSYEIVNRDNPAIVYKKGHGFLEVNEMEEKPADKLYELICRLYKEATERGFCDPHVVFISFTAV